MPNQPQQPNQEREPRQAQPGRDGQEQRRPDTERPDGDQERIDKNPDRNRDRPQQ